jgi:Fic family protein
METMNERLEAHAASLRATLDQIDAQVLEVEEALKLAKRQQDAVKKAIAAVTPKRTPIKKVKVERAKRTKFVPRESSQRKVIAALAGHDEGLTVKEISKSAGLTVSTVTRVCDHLRDDQLRLMGTKPKTRAHLFGLMRNGADQAAA